MKFTYLIIIFYLFFSCTTRSVEKKVTIENFSTQFMDSIQPTKRMMKEGYIAYNVEIKGNVNDTIIVYFTNNNYPIYLSGKIDERYWEEYLGKTKKYLRIEPYKATKGMLKIRYGLYK